MNFEKEIQETSRMIAELKRDVEAYGERVNKLYEEVQAELKRCGICV